MVGVVKQKDQNSGELKVIEMTFEKYAKKPQSKPQPVFVRFRGGRGGIARGGGRGAGRGMKIAQPAPMLRAARPPMSAGPKVRLCTATTLGMEKGTAPQLQSNSMLSLNDALNEEAMNMESMQVGMPLAKKSKQKSKKKEAPLMKESKPMRRGAPIENEDDDDEMVDLDMVQSSPILAQAAQNTRPMASVQEAKPTATPIPTFDNLIENQHSDGFWTSKAEAVLQLFTVSNELKDETVQELIGKVKFTAGTDLDCVYLTLVALFILREVFEDKKDEWELIAKKAKDYLKNAGLTKPDSIVKKFSLVVKN